MSFNNESKIINKSGNVIGIDIGSTTVKVVLIKDGKLVSESYERHFSQVRQKAYELLTDLKDKISSDEKVKITISGSAGMGVSEVCNLPFIQEVFTTGEAINYFEPNTDVVVELGGEDAKIIFFDKGGMDEKMNGSCAGGTGAFIDQMATLLDVDVETLDKLSLKAEKIYPIASRCGVFAKTDIQPLLNEGAKKEDIAISIFHAVANQTVAGLAQGRKIKGKVAFLGGPIYYCKGLQKAFKEILDLDDNSAIFPSYSRISVALGAALSAYDNSDEYTYLELCEKLLNSTKQKREIKGANPLFTDENEYKEFLDRHNQTAVQYENITTYSGSAYLGIDCGSTTTKLVLITENDEILFDYYSANRGNPVLVVKEQLEKIYSLSNGRINIKSSTVTGYGEELIKHAFHLDGGVVETIAHYSAAKHFNPNVDFILDIGGQDIKCFKIRNNAIDSIMLNEACSSGCGSFIETFAKSMGYGVEEFAKIGLFAEKPVDLGSRCTVFMNSSVKQAQRDGATIGDISAGISMSIIKNAISKVIRVASAKDLGKEIVVQGGTFYNDAVLRSFEREFGREVIRPNIAGLMGAYGAALYSKTLKNENSTIVTEKELKNFVHSSKAINCNGCENHCNLTINYFANGEKYISGNKCEKGAGIKRNKEDEIPNLYKFKYNKITSLPETDGKREVIGIPLALGMYELAPMWHAIFTSLGFKVVLSEKSTRDTYIKGQYTIPSDTICYPAKLMHGHIESLIEKGVSKIFYPCLTYNVSESGTDNHFNCPVVAYYSEILSSNVENINDVKFYYPYLNINNKKELVRELKKYFKEEFDFSTAEIKTAVENGFDALKNWEKDIENEGKRAIDYARKNNKKILVFAGRPYHIDPEINHSIDKLAESLGFVVVSEDAVARYGKLKKLFVLNQWTYHSRMYKAADFVCKNKDAELVQLVSFGCGIDAVTTDEIRSILEKNGKLYTQIKIDEITNLGAVKIRLRSLIGALENRRDK